MRDSTTATAIHLQLRPIPMETFYIPSDKYKQNVTVLIVATNRNQSGVGCELKAQLWRGIRDRENVGLVVQRMRFGEPASGRLSSLHQAELKSQIHRIWYRDQFFCYSQLGPQSILA